MTSTSIPAWMPSGMTRRALLLAGYFKLINRFRRWPALWFVPVSFVVAVGWLATRPEAAGMLGSSADHALLVFVLAVIHGSISVSRRKQRLCAEIENSWVSPLPYQVWAPVRLAFALVVQWLGVAIVLAAIVLAGAGAEIATGDGAIVTREAVIAAGDTVIATNNAASGATTYATWANAATVLLALITGLAAGGTLGWFLMPRFKTPVVGSRYAIVRPVRARWAIAPKLEPLSYWAIAQARVLNNPRVSANTMVIVLLSIPMGTPGEIAIAAAAGWMVGLHLVLTLVATIRTAFAAGWWQGATPLRTSRFALTLNWRAITSQAVACSVVAFIAAAMLRPQMANVAVTSLTMWMLLAIALAYITCAAGLNNASPAAAPLHRWFK